MVFTDEVVGELARVTWPTRDETVRASVTVIFTTIFSASLLAAYDFLWKNIADYFLFSGGTGS
jgi:preprotein translocase subunit SecE